MNLAVKPGAETLWYWTLKLVFCDTPEPAEALYMQGREAKEGGGEGGCPREDCILLDFIWEGGCSGVVILAGRFQRAKSCATASGSLFLPEKG